jgi:hypothetical protein
MSTYWMHEELLMQCQSLKTSVADPDPEPDLDPYVLGLPAPLVRGTDPDPDPCIIKQKY